MKWKHFYKIEIVDFIKTHRNHHLEFGEADSFKGHRLQCSCGESLNIYPPNEEISWEDWNEQINDVIWQLERQYEIIIHPY